MSDMPKIVRDRLQAAMPSGPHPDPDVLTAFAEQALAATEREDVVRHLARCAECREIVALSLPPLEAVGQLAASEERAGRVLAASVRTSAGSRNWFAWTNMRWAALAAAGIAAVAAVLIMNPSKPDNTVAILNKQAETSSPDAGAKPATPKADSEPLPSAKTDKLVAALHPEKRALEVAKDSSAARTREQGGAAAFGMLADNKRTDIAETGQRDVKTLSAPATDAPAANVSSDTDSTSEKVQVSTAQAVAAGESANVAQPAAPAEERLMARNEAPAPIKKAKPALKEEKAVKAQAAVDETQGKLARAYSVSGAALAKQKGQFKNAAAQWSLAQGVLRRSLDSGASWETVLQPEHPLLSIGALGSDVWAGGQAGALFHSSDSGTTWNAVQPSVKAGVLSGDVVAIEIRGATEVVVSTSTKESWSTADGGKSWEKQ